MMETLFVLLTYDLLIFKRLIAKLQMELLPLFCFTPYYSDNIARGIKIDSISIH